jgi:hypothetical protein
VSNVSKHPAALTLVGRDSFWSSFRNLDLSFILLIPN